LWRVESAKLNARWSVYEKEQPVAGEILKRSSFLSTIVFFKEEIDPIKRNAPLFSFGRVERIAHTI
jgi:hypothetical protein